MDKILFSNRLRDLRLKCGYRSQYALAKAYNEKFGAKRKDEAGGSEKEFGGILGTIKNYENDSHNGSPKLEIVCNLCEMLGCDVSYLVGDYDERDYSTHKICEATGLSENAIMRLCGMRKYNQITWYSDMLSAIIEHPEFGSMLSVVRDLVKAGEKESSIPNSVSDYPENVKLRDVYQTKITNLLFEIITDIAPAFEEREDYRWMYDLFLEFYRNKDRNGNYHLLSEIKEEMEQNGLKFDPILFEGERDNG